MKTKAQRVKEAEAKVVRAAARWRKFNGCYPQRCNCHEFLQGLERATTQLMKARGVKW